jgi:hypothetical protein
VPSRFIVKRVISAVLVLLALGVAAFFFLKVRRFLPERPRGAELAPADTLFFVQFPNLRQTALRVPQTKLYQIWREPAVQGFLEKPRRKAPWMRAWAERFDEMARVAPGEFFVAVTSTGGPRPGFVGGFSFAGSQRNAETLAAHLREQLLPGSEIVSAARENWHFFASDSAPLEAMLGRFDGKVGPALMTDRLFQGTVAPLGVGQDFVFYGRPDSLPPPVASIVGLGGPALKDAPEAVAMATKLEGDQLHDTIFLRGIRSPEEGVLSRHTLPLTSPQTLFYYVTHTTRLPPGSPFGMLNGILPSVASMEKTLAEKGLSWSDLPSVIGPELGAMFEWPEDAVMPTMLLASEIRDPAKARDFLEALTNPTTLGAAWRTENHDGISVSSAPSQVLSFVRPTVAITKRFALLGLNAEAVTAALPRTTSKTPSLRESAAFQEIAGSIPKKAAAFGYLDFQRLFERVYRMARPFITLSLAFSAEAGAQFDAGKLPPVEAISNHLSATVLTQYQTEDGTVIESMGTLTIPQLLLGMAAGTAASGLPDVAGVISGNRSPAANPPKVPSPAPDSGAAAAGAAPAPPASEATVP